MNAPEPPFTPPSKDATLDVAEGYFKVYEEYAKTLRMWFVAYGVGGPVLLLTNKAVSDRIAASGAAREIALGFLIGALAQVALAMLNKTVMWATYYGELNASFHDTRRYRWAEWLSRQLWIDFCVDAVTIGCFVHATYRTFIILTTVA